MSKQLKVDLVANTSQFKRAMTETGNQMKLINSEFKNAAAETDQYGNRLDVTGAKKKQLSGVIDQYKTRIQAIKNEQKHWNAELEKGNITEEQHAEKQRELARRLNNTEAEMKRYEGQLKRINAEGKATRKTYEEFDKQFRDVGKTMRDVGAQVGITAGVGFMAMKKVLGDVVGEAKDFYAQMSEVQAISGSTAEEMKELTQQSKDLGKATKFTAQEAAESQANLARAGFNTNEILGAMPGLLDLAASSNLDLGTSANITSNIIRTFNYDANKAGKVADVLAKGAATANTDVQGLGQAMEVAGPVANSLDIALEQVASSAGIMADAGIDGSKSGRMLRQGMLRLSKPTGEAAKQLEKMKVEAFDADGNMKDLDKVVGELEKGLKGQTKQQKAAALSTIFGSESTAGWTVLLDKGSKELKEYTKELENSEGAAKDMADVMQDNAEGAIIRMQSALSGMKIELGEKLLPIISKGADLIGDLANKISEMDEETVTTIAHTALLVTGVLGVTTAVAGLVAGIGAFMMVAGPVGLAIAGGTALLGGLGAALYDNKLKTEKLAEEQKKSKEDALAYGEGLSEGTLKGVKGYKDLYDEAKIKMGELKYMSGDEAKQTVKEIQKAFGEMGDMVKTELEAQQEALTQAITQVFAVAGETGRKEAEEINKGVVEIINDKIGIHDKAIKNIIKIQDEYGTNTADMPKKIRKSYLESLDQVDQGMQNFAKSQEEIDNIAIAVAENKGKISNEAASKHLASLKKSYDEAVESAIEWRSNMLEEIEQGHAQGHFADEKAYEHAKLNLEASFNEKLSITTKRNSEALDEIIKHVDDRGVLLDLASGEEIERQMISDNTLDGMRKTRLETDEEMLERWLETNQETLDGAVRFADSSKKAYQKFLEEYLESSKEFTGDAKEEAERLVNETLGELEKDDERAKEAGKDKGEAFTVGIESTESDVIKGASDILRFSLYELSKGDRESESHGESKGRSYTFGMQNMLSKVKSTSSKMSDTATTELSKTTDGGGGKKAGSSFNRGLSNYQTNAYASGKRVATSGKSGLQSVETSGVGGNFATGFQTGISNKSNNIWNTAWSLGKSALSALKSSIKTASPSKETEETGDDFILGFTNSIDDGKKKAINSAKILGEETLGALQEEVKGHKNTFGAMAMSLETNKEALKVEHTLDNKFDEFVSMFRMFKDKNDEQPIRELLNATLQQNEILMQLLQKDNNLYLDGDVIKDDINQRNAVSAITNIF